MYVWKWLVLIYMAEQRTKIAKIVLKENTLDIKTYHDEDSDDASIDKETGTVQQQTIYSHLIYDKETIKYKEKNEL